LIQGHHLHYNTYTWVHDEYLHGHLYEAGWIEVPQYTDQVQLIKKTYKGRP
jgi:hypothetical protein